MTKILVTFFSASGVTKDVASKIAKVTGGDLFEIVPVEPYTDADLNWRNSKSRSSIEMNDSHSRPEIRDEIDNMDEYDVVFVGYPIWWGVAPHIIDTFLESYDFKGKTIVPFCTSGGSGVGKSDSDLHHDVDGDVKWVKGKLIGHAVDAEIKKWVDGII